MPGYAAAGYAAAGYAAAGIVAAGIAAAGIARNHRGIANQKREWVAKRKLSVHDLHHLWSMQGSMHLALLSWGEQPGSFEDFKFRGTVKYRLENPSAPEAAPDHRPLHP